MGLPKFWGTSDGLKGFVFSHVKTIYYNYAQKKLLSTKLDEMDANINSKIAKSSMSNQQVNDTSKVPTSALVYNMQNSINTLNANRDTMSIKDTRTENLSPIQYITKYGQSMKYEFKEAGTSGLPAFSAVMTFIPWTDATGGYPHQLAFCQNGNIYHRKGSADSTWGNWRTI